MYRCAEASGAKLSVVDPRSRILQVMCRIWRACIRRFAQPTVAIQDGACRQIQLPLHCLCLLLVERNPTFLQMIAERPPRLNKRKTRQESMYGIYQTVVSFGQNIKSKTPPIKSPTVPRIDLSPIRNDTLGYLNCS